MKWALTIKKALLGVLTFAVAYLAANPQVVLQLVPQAIQQMTVGAVISGLLVGVANWLKNKDNK